MATPTITVKGDDGSSRVVSFTLGRLLKIEKATGKGVNEFVFGDLGPFLRKTAEVASTDPFEPDADKDVDGAVDKLDAADTGSVDPTAEVGDKAVDPAAVQRHREEMIGALRSVSLGTMMGFVAGSLDVSADQLERIVGPARLMGVFFELVGPFIAAVGVINSGEEEPKTDPPAPASVA